MKWGEIETHWQQFERTVNYKWGALTAGDLKQINGNKGKLNTQLQRHYGHSKEETNKSINAFLGTFQGILHGEANMSSKIDKRLPDKPIVGSE